MNIKYRKVEGMLNEYTTIVNEIKNIDLDIEELKSNFSGCRAISYNEKSSPTYKFNSTVENEVVAKEEKINRLEKLKRSKEIQVQRIDNAMKILKEDEFNVIKYRFFQEHKKSWTKVSYNMQMCEAWCRKLKDRAIKKMIPLIFVSEQSIEKIAE
ncbi:hypothetical protein KYB31_04055 [Clostridium felsineum]|uniref:hypothetical protein n=1 Tax=Clostridium felsineum TaxID=36839 RepID=UPI00214D5D71|nr:hypothetical protein [Clostridium felsineum]MCR3758171.1 hypothetical protein [Clostridium felsineum]